MLPPRLAIPDQWVPPADGEAQWADDETPRSPPQQRPGSLPSSPSARKTKSRAGLGRALRHTSSLRDTKVLAVSDMHRSESVADPSLFQYHQHFESPWQLVGKTHLSEVFRVRHRGSGQVYAVKRSRRRFRSKLQRERCLREIRAVAALPPHPNIVNQYRAWQEGGHFYIQMDYCEGGSLGQQAQRACSAGRCMSDGQLWAAACQAAQGLAFLHAHGVLHLDVKPDNIYLGSGGPGGGGPTWRIGDFGLAVAREQDGSMDWEEGDGDYVAPELLRAGGEPSAAADIFSLGATLYQIATGLKLPRSEGWTEGSAEALELPGRPPAFVALLRAMLQPDPDRRPTAQQVIGVVEREQPAVAAAAAESVAAAAAAAAAQPAGAAAIASQLSPVVINSGAQALVPSPFETTADCSPTPQGSAAGAPAAAASTAADPSQFSFDVPAAPRDSFAFTPGQPLRPHNHARRASSSGGGGFPGAPPGTAVKGTPVGRARLGGPSRWAPALSPLISEGALTPGAQAALVGLTPGTHGSAGGASDCAPTPTLAGFAAGSGSSGGSGSGHRGAATPLDARRPAPLQLPPQTAAPVAACSGGAMSTGNGVHPNSSGTQGSGDGWRLCRRDILSPDSDFLAGSHSEDDYSYSCGTGRTMSDLEFADALSPMSQELAGFGASAGATPSTGTPENPPAHGQECSGPCSVPSISMQQYEAAVSAGLPQQAPPARQGSLAWDLHTSPEFLMQLPPGSPDSLSRSSSFDDGGSLPSSRAMSVRRFPTLDSWGSALDGAATLAPSGAAAGKQPAAPAPAVQRVDSLAALAAQRFTHTFAQQGPALAGSGGEAAAAEAGGTGPLAAAAPRGLRKRQHSSRRTLIQALSRENSAASSLDGMQPTGKARHLCDPDSAATSPAGPPDRPPLLGLGLSHASSLQLGLPPVPGRPLPRSGSLLGREAAAASAAALAEAAARSLAAGLPADASLSPAGTPTAQCQPGFFQDSARAARQLSCMKLRDGD